MLALFIFALISLAAASPFLDVPVENRSINEIYEAALKENKTLRVAWGGDVQASGSGIRHYFENRFPGIKLDLSLDLSKYLDAEIDRQYKKTNGLDEFADVAVLQSLHDFPRWKAEGRLLPYKVSQWNDIYSKFVDEEGAYTGLYIFSFGSTVYNPTYYRDPDAIPTTYPDFLKPQFFRRIVLTYPNDDDAILFLFTLIVQKYGWGFMDSLAKQQVTWVRGTATPSILGGDNSTTNPLSISFASSSAFASGVSSKMSQDVYMAWPQTGAIFARAQAPETAKLFMNYLMDDQWQDVVGERIFATRKSFDRFGVFKQKNMDPLKYFQFMSNRTDVESWRGQFESVVGPPQGPNPNQEF
ncbi:hypothetical protein CPB84DRAFT_1846992 [Gymnopilus junonius]|uniref:Periplasmic binding protein-like II n=1 Tax=Gymnopilus junonius TaxID=109634 RepID=A0A9P5NPR3_GYMJU|nr:hypothetical protein CPB84DRAFT_1846992 [Gymnopilus junonius]